MSQTSLTQAGAPQKAVLQRLAAEQRFHTKMGWLDSWHSFSFADHYDANRLGFRALRVINDDRVAPASGFGMHSHRDMEIITYVVSGALGHRDSMGHQLTIERGEVQRMTAGTLVTHAEMNESPDQGVHFLQIWIFPSVSGLEPAYEQRGFSDEDKRNRWLCVASGDQARGGLFVHQDVHLLAAILEPQLHLEYQFAPLRHGWLQIVSGDLQANGVQLKSGDGLAISQVDELTVTASAKTEVLLFDLA